MAIVKVLEVIAESTISWEDAAQQAILEASKTVKNIESIYIKDMKASVKNDKVEKYLIIAKISFKVIN